VTIVNVYIPNVGEHKGRERSRYDNNGLLQHPRLINRSSIQRKSTKKKFRVKLHHRLKGLKKKIYRVFHPIAEEYSFSQQPKELL
jgi:hypothetical protein